MFGLSRLTYTTLEKVHVDTSQRSVNQTVQYIDMATDSSLTKRKDGIRSIDGPIFVQFVKILLYQVASWWGTPMLEFLISLSDRKECCTCTAHGMFSNLVLRYKTEWRHDESRQAWSAENHPKQTHTLSASTSFYSLSSQLTSTSESCFQIKQKLGILWSNKCCFLVQNNQFLGWLGWCIGWVLFTAPNICSPSGRRDRQ